MTVNELIALLFRMDGERRVVVRGYEGGVNDVVEVIAIDVNLNVNDEEWFGSHEVVGGYVRSRGAVPAVHINGSHHEMNGEI